jgi:hypothetical protein
LKSQRFSRRSRIPLESIERLEARAPRPLATRGHFIVHFLEEGEQRERLIILPGSMGGGTTDWDKANAVLRQAGLLSDDPAAS